MRIRSTQVREDVATVRFGAGPGADVAVARAAAARDGRREVAIRIALGAERGNVMWKMLLDGMGPAIFGLIIGLVVAFLIRDVLLPVRQLPRYGPILSIVMDSLTAAQISAPAEPSVM